MRQGIYSIKLSTCFGLVLTVLLIIILLNPTKAYAAAPDTHYITEVEVPTPGSGPLAVAVDSKGDVWFTESNASKIAKYDPISHQFEEFQLPQGEGDMWGIIVTREGEVWFTQYGASSASTYASGGFLPGGRGTLWNFDPFNNSFHSYSLDKLGTMPFRLAEDKSGRIWFTELLGNSLGVFDPKTKQFSQFSVPTENSGPADLYIDSANRIWFTESTARAIGVYDPSNSKFKEFRFDSILAPVGISIDPSGLVWIADHGLNRIGQFNPATGALITFPTSNPANGIFPYSLPNDLSIDRYGEVWFTEHVANRIGKIDPVHHTLTEYQIPSGPISTALWLAIMPNGNICFAEYSDNKIGILDPTMPISFSVTLAHDYAQVRQGSTTPVELTVNGQAENLHLFVASTSTIPNTLNASFSSNPVNIESLPNTSPVVVVDIEASQSVIPGQYVMAIGGSLNQVSVSVLLPVNIIEQSWVIIIIPYVFAGLGIGLLLVFVKRKRNPRRKRRRNSRHIPNPITSLRNFTEEHKIGLLILGVATTNLFGAAGGGLHLLILEAPTRIIPYSNATLSTYGFFSFWLDVVELGSGLLTVYFVLLAWKPRKRIAMSIMLGIILIASSLFIITSIPNARPANCDIVIKNSLFYGGYYPASFTVTTTNNVATVTWCVDSNSIHSDTVTSDTGIFNSGPIAQSASWSYTFTQPGEYHYHSLIHFWMHGTIIVMQETQSISETTQIFQYGATIFQIGQDQKVGLFIPDKLTYIFFKRINRLNKACRSQSHLLTYRRATEHLF
ncbi:MAG TPA: hypothetical protein VJZ32_07200 [Candidatus Bathyarchaeia archaeon]|nr:hypothetical protein [Candidatus Bathyarchaeia archaeon]